jgi:hypothetical protein
VEHLREGLEAHALMIPGVVVLAAGIALPITATIIFAAIETNVDTVVHAIMMAGSEV